MTAKPTHPDPEGAKINVVDHRHHVRPEGATDANESVRSRFPSFVEELKDRTELAEKRALEAIARADAELEAVRERLAKDVDRRVSQGKAAFLGSMLEVADNLDRAARGASQESPAIRDGLDLIRQQLAGALNAQGVEPIETLGQPYDPHVAEAVVVEPVEAARDNLVIEELQRGYRLGDVILRPARVKVGRAAV